MKVFNISPGEEFIELRSRGFTRAKLCGDGVEGLILAIGMNYIEGLILSQHTSTNGYIFIEKYLQEFENEENFREILDWLNKVKLGVADHESFARAVLNSQDMQAEVFNFTLSVFKIEEGNFQINKVLDYLITASIELNLQFMIYSNNGLTHSIMKNRYIYPIVINIFTPKESEAYYMLYHENYKIISPENLNTSEEYAKENEEVHLSPNKRLIKKLVNELSTLEKIDQEDREQLLGYLNDLKQLDYLGYKSEKLLSHLLN